MSTLTAEQKVIKARLAARRRRLVGYGQWEPFVDSEPVRRHVRAVQATGMPLRAMEEILHLPRHTFKHLLWGSSGLGPSSRIRKETAVAVLSYWPCLDDYPDTALIDETGTQRRIQALSTLGWTNTWMAARIGMRASNFNRSLWAGQVTARLARAVRDMYDECWSRRPYEIEVQAWVAERCRMRAASSGWHGPLAWDDDTIDDPRVLPVTDVAQPAATDGGNLAARWLMGESVILSPGARKEVLAHLFEWTNDTTAEIAERLDMTPEAAERQWERMKAKAAVEGRRLWRRAYVPRERTMKQSQMEEAA